VGNGKKKQLCCISLLNRTAKQSNLLLLFTARCGQLEDVCGQLFVGRRQHLKQLCCISLCCNLPLRFTAGCGQLEDVRGQLGSLMSALSTGNCLLHLSLLHSTAKQSILPLLFPAGCGQLEDV
jgi:hypothetical protein